MLYNCCNNTKLDFCDQFTIICFFQKMYPEGRNETWNPCHDLFSQCKETNYAVLILNTNINLPLNLLVNLWNQGIYTICKT